MFAFFSASHVCFSFIQRWKNKLKKLNEAVAELSTKERGARIQPFSEKEFLIGLGITVAAAGFNCRGCELWAKASKQDPLDSDPKTWGNIIPSPDFGRYMRENRFKEYRKVTATI